MKAILEIEFDKETMIDDEDLKYWDNDLLKFMKELIEDEGIGIFDNEIKLIDIKGDDDLSIK